jgi:hypothetical protein
MLLCETDMQRNNTARLVPFTMGMNRFLQGVKGKVCPFPKVDGCLLA